MWISEVLRALLPLLFPVALLLVAAVCGLLMTISILRSLWRWLVDNFDRPVDDLFPTTSLRFPQAKEEPATR